MDIEQICRRYGIQNYTINEDGSIDVNQNVNFYNRKLTELPLNFNIVDGNFTCAVNFLTTLKGSPKKVTGYFNCNNNEGLKSLEHAPVEVGGGFGGGHCGLTSLEHFPQSVGHKILLNNNSIESMKGLPSICHDKLGLKENKISSLEHIPNIIEGGVDLEGNLIRSFDYLPQEVKGTMDFYANPIHKIYDFENFEDMKTFKILKVINKEGQVNLKRLKYFYSIVGSKAVDHPKRLQSTIDRIEITYYVV